VRIVKVNHYIKYPFGDHQTYPLEFKGCLVQ
jgi:hypothetical protein